MKRTAAICLLIGVVGASACTSPGDGDNAGDSASAPSATTDGPSPTTEAPATTEDASSTATSTPTTAEPTDDESTSTATEEAVQFPDNPPEYVAAWVEAWAAGETARADELAAAAPSALVTCLGTTQGEWVLEEEVGDMAGFAGGEGLWWSTVLHQPTGAVLYVYTDQALYGAENAIVGADLHTDPNDNESIELPPIEDCYATEILPAVEAWGDGDPGPITTWVSQDSRDDVEEWGPSFAGTGAEIIGLESMERYGADSETEDYSPTVGMTLGYDDDGGERSFDTVLFQLYPDVLAETTDGSLYRVTYTFDRRFI